MRQPTKKPLRLEFSFLITRCCHHQPTADDSKRPFQANRKVVRQKNNNGNLAEVMILCCLQELSKVRLAGCWGWHYNIDLKHILIPFNDFDLRGITCLAQSYYNIRRTLRYTTIWYVHVFLNNSAQYPGRESGYN